MPYQGWRNRATWNVALWIGNDEGLYNMALEHPTYESFRETLREIGVTETPDGYSFWDSALDLDELNGMMRELRGEEDELPEPDSDTFNTFMQQYLNEAYNRGAIQTEYVDTPIPEDEVSMIFENWHQTAWWANDVLPDFRQNAINAFTNALGKSLEELGYDDWDEVDEAVEEQYPEWISEAIDDQIEAIENGFIETLQEAALIIEE